MSVRMSLRATARTCSGGMPSSMMMTIRNCRRDHGLTRSSFGQFGSLDMGLANESRTLH